MFNLHEVREAENQRTGKLLDIIQLFYFFTQQYFSIFKKQKVDRRENVENATARELGFSPFESDMYTSTDIIILKWLAKNLDHNKRICELEHAGRN